MLTNGTVLQNRYEIIEPIGQGGMGAVYLARDQRLSNTVALKETFFLDTVMLNAFEREARLLAGLRHPALPKVIDHFADHSGQFLVMEYIPGDDLHHVVEQRGAIPVEEVLQWADQLLDALEYLHAQDPPIIHRDIKPQNLKLTARDKVVLLDFGLAKGMALGATRSSSNSSIFGYTPSYASLEQVRGSGTDAQSDLYSLAATLYQLLTGIEPADALARASRVLDGQPDPLIPACQARPSVPAGVSEVIMKALALNRTQRLSTAAQMRELLGECNRPVNQEVATKARVSPPRAAALPETSTRVLASSSMESAGGQEYSGHPPVTEIGGATPPRINERAAPRARPTANVWRAPATVGNPRQESSGKSKIVAAVVVLLVAVGMVVFVFARGIKRDDRNLPQVNVQKSEPSGAAPTSAQTAVDQTGNANPVAQPAAPVGRTATDAPAVDSPNGTQKDKETAAGQEPKPEEPIRETGRVPAMQEAEGTKPIQVPQPAKPEDRGREEPPRPDPSGQYPPPREMQPPPPYPPPPDGMPPPGGMPPPRRRPPGR